jgi:hypothetical protein
VGGRRRKIGSKMRRRNSREEESDPNSWLSLLETIRAHPSLLDIANVLSPK